MKTKLLVICYVLLLVACSKEDDVPDDLLPKAEMVPLFIDIYIAESRVNNLRLSRDSSMAIFDVYEGELFKQHEVTDSVYYRSMTYYYNHPKQLEEIYSIVLDSLNLREQRLKEKREKEEVRDDKKSGKEKKEIEEERK
ncbi:DUF4296 domain-containing protein [Fulvivirga sp. 29W222]|uniref:DUF4296 domain-containing protein n=1 Tax=Fulvivirga marina TaxID=2494733 RepID=A0A937FVX3_9BACT|nr:DUF4296 domain-containing protein [Fulvivirga marina]MBL6445978.1 DUF4296 domain-containing protein [Fulvivirga marina]